MVEPITLTARTEHGVLFSVVGTTENILRTVTTVKVPPDRNFHAPLRANGLGPSPRLGLIADLDQQRNSPSFQQREVIMKKLLVLGLLVLIAVVGLHAEDKPTAPNKPTSNEPTESQPSEPKTATPAPSNPAQSDASKVIAELKAENELLKKEIQEMKLAVELLRETQRGFVTKKDVETILDDGLKPIKTDLSQMQLTVVEMVPLLEQIAKEVAQLTKGQGPGGIPGSPKECTLVVRNLTGVQQMLLVDGSEWRVPAFPQESLIKVPVLRSDSTIQTELWPHEKPRIRKLKEVNGRYQTEVEIMWHAR